MPKFYDVTTGPFNEGEELYFPFSVSIANELSNNGNTSCWKPVDEGGFAAFLASECIWMQFWVELHGEKERQDYLAYFWMRTQSHKKRSVDFHDR